MCPSIAPVAILSWCKYYAHNPLQQQALSSKQCSVCWKCRIVTLMADRYRPRFRLAGPVTSRLGLAESLTWLTFFCCDTGSTWVKGQPVNSTTNTFRFLDTLLLVQNVGSYSFRIFTCCSFTYCFRPLSLVSVVIQLRAALTVAQHEYLQVIRYATLLSISLDAQELTQLQLTCLTFSPYSYCFRR